MNLARRPLVVSLALAALAGCESLVKYVPAPEPPASSMLESTTLPTTTRPARSTPQAAPTRTIVKTTPTPAVVTTTSERPATQPVDVGPAVAWPIAVERFERPGPVRGVVARVDLTDPRVSVAVALADPRDPDGPAGPAVGQLQTVSRAAEAQHLALAMNASFFKIAGSRDALGKRVGYFVGNGAWPVGWHIENGVAISTPINDSLRATVIVHQDRSVTLEADVRQLPGDAAYAVSGNVKVLDAGVATVTGLDLLRHPRSAVGLTADRKTLLFVVVDGRRDGWSAGATLGELATVMKSLGAADAINLDGGGGSDLVVKDAVTGVYAIANRPSERAALTPGLDSVERPVVDVIGVRIKDE